MNRWTDKDVAHLRSRYGVELAASIAVTLGRTVSAVEMKAKRLGLTSKRKGSPLHSSTANLEAMHAKGADHPQGHAVGAVWLAAGRLWTRTTVQGKPRPLARVVLEREGYDLRGLIVVHVDGDPLNCEPSNLRALTKAEHVVRNNGRCADKALRSARASISRSGDSFLDYLLKGGFVE